MLKRPNRTPLTLSAYFANGMYHYTVTLCPLNFLPQFSAAELPEKTCIYSTVIGLINVSNHSLGGEIVEFLVQSLKENLRKCEWEKARLLIRLFADLVNANVVSPGSLLNLFENLIDVMLDDNIPQVRSDYYVFTVLSALPFVGRKLSKEKESDLDSLLNTIETYMPKRSKAHLSGIKVWSSDSPHPQEEYLDCLWSQIQRLKQDKWNERHINRVYLSFETKLEEGLQHNVPQIIPPPHEANFIYPMPRSVFRLFDYTDCPEGSALLPGVHAIERFLVEESILNTINLFYYDRKDCARSIMAFPGAHKLPYEYMVIEVILGELFKLPTPTHLEIFYGSLLLELCKLQPQTIPQVLAQGVELLFDRIGTMNGICNDRMASWFAYHLSNFQFRWNWSDWESAVKLDPLHPKVKFIKESLVRCMRLSYHGKVMDIVTDTFHPLCPPDPAPVNKYAPMVDTKEGKVYNALQVEFQNRSGDSMALLSGLGDADGGEEVSPVLKVDVYVNSLLNFSSKSFSHLFAALGRSVFKLSTDLVIIFFGCNRCRSQLQALCSTLECQEQLLRSFFDVWGSHQQLLIVAIQKLLKADVITAESVANWIFSDAMSSEISKSYVWEILHETIARKKRSIKALNSDLVKEKSKLAKYQGGDVKGDDGMDSGNGQADDDDDVPSEEKIERMEERLDNMVAALKNLMIFVLTKCVTMITGHISRCESDGKPFKDYWFRWSIYRLQSVLFEVSFLKLIVSTDCNCVHFFS